MTNAKKELLDDLETLGATIKCAQISLCRGYAPQGNKVTHILPVGYDEQMLDKFLRDIDFVYDSGYGGQELFGTVWLNDGTWMDRGEYDGSEWWEHHSLPEIPECLKRVAKPE